MRAFNRILSLLLGLALITGGLLVVVEVVTAFVRDTPWPIRVDQWAATLRQQTFADTIPRIVFLATAAVGLLLLVAEARPWPKRSLNLTSDGQRSWWLHRRSAERQIARAVRSGTSATAAKVHLRPRGPSWRLRVGVTASPEARPDIEQRARAAIQRLGGPQDAPVRVRIAKARRVT
jgi:hypothetical protein